MQLPETLSLCSKASSLIDEGARGWGMQSPSTLQYILNIFCFHFSQMKTTYLLILFHLCLNNEFDTTWMCIFWSCYFFYQREGSRRTWEDEEEAEEDPLGFSFSFKRSWTSCSTLWSFFGGILAQSRKISSPIKVIKKRLILRIKWIKTEDVIRLKQHICLHRSFLLEFWHSPVHGVIISLQFLR